MSSQLRADQFITELCESLSAGEYSPRQNIFHAGLDWAGADGVEPWEFKKASTVLPSIWEQKHSKRIEEATRLGVEQLNTAAQFLRAVIEPREALAGKTLKEQVLSCRAFIQETRRIIRRANAALREACARVEIVIASNQVALRGGVLCPHVHLLLRCQRGVAADAGRSAIRVLFEDTAAALAYASPEKRGFLKEAEAVKAHVNYLYNYPVSRYVTGEKEAEQLPLLMDEPYAFVAALAALGNGDGLSLKNTIVVMGSLRAKPVRNPSTITKTGAPIRVGAESEVAKPSDTQGAVEGAAGAGQVAKEYLSGQDLEQHGHYYEPPLVLVPPVWELMLAMELSAPAVPPLRSCRPLPHCSPSVLKVVDELTQWEGFFRRRVLLRGCRGMSIEEVSARFPEHGEAWIVEQNFDCFLHGGHNASTALKLARHCGALWRKQREMMIAAYAAVGDSSPPWRGRAA